MFYPTIMEQLTTNLGGTVALAVMAYNTIKSWLNSAEKPNVEYLSSKAFLASYQQLEQQITKLSVKLATELTDIKSDCDLSGAERESRTWYIKALQSALEYHAFDLRKLETAGMTGKITSGELYDLQLQIDQVSDDFTARHQEHYFEATTKRSESAQAAPTKYVGMRVAFFCEGSQQRVYTPPALSCQSQKNDHMLT